MRLPAVIRTAGPVGIPILGVVVLALGWNAEPSLPAIVVMAIVLAATVLAAVHHAEVIAHKVGEPFGSLVLAVAVTVIEVALIITLVVSGGPETASLARDTVFAAVMITTNGIVGLCLLVGALRHGLIRFNAEGAGALLATVTTLAVLCFVLPTFTSGPSAQFSTSQLVFVAIASLALYALFVTTQTLKHRDFFLPVAPDGKALRAEDHAAAPSTRRALVSLGHAAAGAGRGGRPREARLPVDRAGRRGGRLPGLVRRCRDRPARAASREHRGRAGGAAQPHPDSLNLALGSAMASIGLTIPAIAVASFFLDGPLLLGLGPTQIVLLVLTVVVSILTLAPGRATRLQGGVHLVVFAAFVFLSIAP